MASANKVKAGEAYVELGADQDQLRRDLRKASRTLTAFGRGMQGTGALMTGTAGAVLSVVGLATRVFAGFDDEMRSLRAVTGATAEEFAMLTDEAKRLGSTTSFSASEVARGMAELGRAGFDPSQILASTQAVLALSRATGTELPRATEIAGGVLRGFNLDASQMSMVADVLTATANKSSQTLEDLGEAMKPLAPIAAEAGEDIVDVSAAIGILANNSIKGSLAGNSLARAYKNVSSTAVQSTLREMGVEAVDAEGNLRPMAEIINDLATASEGLGSGVKLNLFETLFGRGQAAALKLASSGSAFGSLRDEIRDSAGVAEATAEEMDKGIGGSFRRMLSSVEGSAIAVGEAIEGPMSRAADIVGMIASKVTAFVENNGALVRTVVMITAGLFAFGLVLLTAGTAIVIAGAALASLSTVLGVIGPLLAAVLSPLGLVIAAVVILATTVTAFAGDLAGVFEWVKTRLGELWSFIAMVLGGIKDAIAVGDIFTAVRILLTGIEVALGSTVGRLESLWYGMITGFADAIDTFRTVAVGALDAITAKAASLITTLSNELGIDEFVLGVDLTDEEAALAASTLVGNARDRNLDRLRGLGQRTTARGRARDARDELAEKQLADAYDRLRALRESVRPGEASSADLADSTNEQEKSIADAIAAVFAGARGLGDGARLTARGTFGGDTRVLGASTEGQRTASAAERAADGVEELVRNARRGGGLTFG